MTPEEQRVLAVSCLKSAPICRTPSIISFDLKELAAYTAAVEANKQAELDKANARIAQLEEALDVADNYVPVYGRDEAHNVNVELINKAMIDKSPDTWLLEHDKAVEVRVLEEAKTKVIECEPYWDVITEWLDEMIESRK